MIRANSDLVLARRGMSSQELSQRLGITPANLSILKTNKGKAIRFSTLDAACKALACNVSDLLEYVDDGTDAK